MCTHPEVCSHSLRHAGEHAELWDEGYGLQNVLFAPGSFLGSGQQERLFHILDSDAVLLLVIVDIGHLSFPLDGKCAQRVFIPIDVAYLVRAVVIPKINKFVLQ